jgi:hypothetical protein
MRYFPQDTVQHGDDGQWMRAYRIQCNRCQRIDKVPINTSSSSGGGDDAAQIARRVQTKLEKDGWVVGKREQDDRCPKCRFPQAPPTSVAHPNNKIDEIRETQHKLAERLPPDDNAFLTKKTPAPASETPPVIVTPPPVTPDVTMPDKPNGHGREFTREDRRIIWAKLEDVYDCESTGYEPGWTDARVARDLNVSRDWVVKIREENFGLLADNPEMRAVITEAHQLFDDVKAIRTDVQRVVATMTTLLDEAKKYQADIQRIAQRVQPMEKRIADLLKVNS